MTYNSPNASSSILKDGKLRPGVYKIQNIVGKTYLDTKDDLRELCCRPFTALENGRTAQWDIQPLGAGYTIRKAGPGTSGRPDQFCMMLSGTSNGCAVAISDFPVAWRIEVVTDPKHQGYEYVRFFWGSTNMAWDLAGWGSKADGTKVQVMQNTWPEQCRIWELTSVKFDDVAARQPSSSELPRDSTSAPPYEADTGNHCCSCSHVVTEPNDDGFGTTVVEVTTVTTRKKYRVEDA